MQTTTDTSAIRCGRCGQPVATRGGRRAAYCSVCGQPLAPPAANVEHRFGPAPNVEHRFRAQPAATWFDVLAILFALMSLVPGCGFVFGIAAIILANAGAQRVDEAGRSVGMSGTGRLALTIGVLGLLVQFTMCGLCRGAPIPRF